MKIYSSVVYDLWEAALYKSAGNPQEDDVMMSESDDIAIKDDLANLNLFVIK